MEKPERILKSKAFDFLPILSFALIYFFDSAWFAMVSLIIWGFAIAVRNFDN